MTTKAMGQHCLAQEMNPGVSKAGFNVANLSIYVPPLKLDPRDATSSARRRLRGSDIVTAVHMCHFSRSKTRHVH